MDEKNSILVVGGINMGISMYVKQMPEVWGTAEASSTVFETDGKASRISSAARRLGADVSIIGKVGQDSYGESILQSLSKMGIHTQHVGIVKDTPTGIVVLMRTEKKETSVLYSPGANMVYTEGEITKLEPFFAQHKIVVLSNKAPVFVIREVIQLAKKLHLLIVFDPTPVADLPPDIFADVDILLPSEPDIRSIAGTDSIDLNCSRLALSHFMEMGVKKAVILKIGTDGVLINTCNEFIALGSIHVANEIDRRGDKDIFIAAMAVAFSQKKNLYQASEYAKAAAQLSNSQTGIRATLPTKEQLQTYLNENPIFREMPYSD